MKFLLFNIYFFKIFLAYVVIQFVIYKLTCLPNVKISNYKYTDSCIQLFLRDEILMDEFLKKIENYQLLLLGLFFSLSLIISTGMVSRTLSRSGIEVTGSAVEIVKSDSAAWDLDITTSAKNKKKAYDQLIKNKDLVLKYLLAKGFGANEIAIQNMNSYPVFKKSTDTGEDTNEIDHYELSQTFIINSNNIQLIKDVSLDAENLLNQGIDVKSNPPSYFYTKLSDLKIKLLNEASEDAKRRAKAMLKSTGNRVGAIKSVKTGVFQITPPNSTEVSDYGIYDTSSIDKKITAVTQVTFSIR